MCISLKTVFLLSILIINIQRLESAKLNIRNEPVSGKFISSLCSHWCGQVDNIAFLAKQLDPVTVIDIAHQSTSDFYNIFEQKLTEEVEKKIRRGYVPTNVKYIAPVDYDKVSVYGHVEEKKKEEKTGKEKPITVTESYKPTTSVYVPTITAKYIAPVTRPYSTKTTAVKYTKQYVPPKTEKPTTTTMMPYMPDVSAYDSSAYIPEVPEGMSISNPEEEEDDEY
uniref:Uncharacterized protein n=1 Tax=Tetranychus urticae TaxID=32264 RepID=T1K4Z8_TETUR